MSVFLTHYSMQHNNAPGEGWLERRVKVGRLEGHYANSSPFTISKQ